MKLIEKVAQSFHLEREFYDYINMHLFSVKVKKGEQISRNGTYNRNVYFVEEGLMRTFYYEDGKDITTNFYTEGKLIANIDTLFGNQPTQYNIEALEDSQLVFCNYEKLEELCGKSLPVANFSRYILGNLMAQMYHRISSLQHMTAKEKYEQLLSENPNIVLRAPLGTIASYLGISQETLSRIRR